ncbi:MULTISPECIES: hypothetical protein [unclassified Streptomyces]|uniref:hypothetical protein n=1 Tax=unclassified Streptomyces TaxID=2593676 RepID=UPI0037000866
MALCAGHMILGAGTVMGETAMISSRIVSVMTSWHCGHHALVTGPSAEPTA